MSNIYEDFKSSLEYHTELNKDIFDSNEKIHSDIRNRLLKIANLFYSNMKMFRNIEISDIILTGGNANYNYTAKSDIDVHIVCNFGVIPIDSVSIQDYIFAKKKLWGYQHDIKIHGYPVELFVQNIIEKVPQDQGVYSILTDQWETHPVKLNLNFDNIPNLGTKVEFYQTEIENILSSHASLEAVKELKIKINEIRSRAIAKNGEFSFGNLLYKDLRNNGYIDILNNYEKRLIDISYTI